MSTLALENPTRDLDRRPSLVRLTAVELRKMIDTRAGFWVLLSILALTVAALVVTLFVGDVEDHLFKNMFIMAAAPFAILLPIVGILLVSSEWTQRTTLITFAHVPRRDRVVAAKLLAGVVLAAIAVLVAVVLGALGTAIAQPSVDEAWSMPARLFGQVALYVVVSMLMGIGIGAMLLSSPLAIVLYFVAPIGLSAIGAIPWFDGVVPWVEWWSSVSRLADKPLDAGQWAHAGTAMAVWVALPILAGLWRISRQEIS